LEKFARALRHCGRSEGPVSHRRNCAQRERIGFPSAVGAVCARAFLPSSGFARGRGP
jgi:hypothetical protein